MILRILLVLVVTASGCGRVTSASLTSDEIQALTTWRPMSKGLRESFPELKILMSHRLSQTDIAALVADSVAIERPDPADKQWYVPVAPSRGIVLFFDEEQRLCAVDPIGEARESWMGFLVSGGWSDRMQE